VYANRFRGSVWLLRVLEGPTWRSIPGSPAPQESLWHYLVLLRPSRRCGCCFQTHPRISQTAFGSGRANALHGDAEPLRRFGSPGVAMVLERAFCEPTHYRSDRSPPGVWESGSNVTVNDASLPDRWSG